MALDRALPLSVGMTFISDQLVHRVIGCAIDVHRELGPGLLESTYGRCFRLELSRTGIPFANEVWLPLVYKGHRLENAYRIDLMIEDRLIVEVKAIDKLLPVHVAQVMTYLRLSGAHQGLLINFNESRLKDGLKSVMLRERTASSASEPSTDEKM
jgi:GxxExxY protein